MLNKKYKLFPSCEITIGNQRALIVDTHKSKLYFIPNLLAKYFKEIKIVEKKRLQEYFQKDYEVALEYVDYLLENNLLYDLELLPFISESKPKYASRSIVTNAIIEIGDLPDYQNLLLQLDQLRVQAVEIRNFSDANLLKFLYHLKGLNIRHVDIITAYDTELLQQVREGNERRIKLLHFFNAPKDEEIHIEDIDLYIVYNSIEKMNNISCGCISNNNFNLTSSSYIESLDHNSCLNRKISIDAEGNIKNCPSMRESFGNIIDTTLVEAIEKQGFKKYWNINKDKIHVCKDCEFRHVCTDCRAYVENPEDILSKPLKCGYNPYTSEWSKWSTNPLKQKAIDFYEMRDIITD